MAEPTIHLRVVTNNFPAIRRNIQGGAKAAVAKAARDIEGHAKSRAPVDTGFLRNSILASMVSTDHWRVAVGAHYGIYVEYGTRHTRAQPYFIPAIEAVLPAFRAAMARIAVP